MNRKRIISAFLSLLLFINISAVLLNSSSTIAIAGQVVERTDENTVNITLENISDYANWSDNGSTIKISKFKKI